MCNFIIVFKVSYLSIYYIFHNNEYLRLLKSLEPEKKVLQEFYLAYIVEVNEICNIYVYKHFVSTEAPVFVTIVSSIQCKPNIY